MCLWRSSVRGALRRPVPMAPAQNTPFAPIPGHPLLQHAHKYVLTIEVLMPAVSSDFCLLQPKNSPVGRGRHKNAA